MLQSVGAPPSSGHWNVLFTSLLLKLKLVLVLVVVLSGCTVIVVSGAVVSSTTLVVAGVAAVPRLSVASTFTVYVASAAIWFASVLPSQVSLFAPADRAWPFTNVRTRLGRCRPS